MKKLICAAIVACALGLLIGAPAVASTCTTFAAEDSSAPNQNRARFFVATDLNDVDGATGLGVAYAIRAADQFGLDYVDVFVTRAQDGRDRADHNSTTAMAWVRFNPGSTPIIPAVWDVSAATSLTDMPVWPDGIPFFSHDDVDAKRAGELGEAHDALASTCVGARPR